MIFPVESIINQFEVKHVTQTHHMNINHSIQHIGPGINGAANQII